MVIIDFLHDVANSKLTPVWQMPFYLGLLIAWCFPSVVFTGWMLRLLKLLRGTHGIWQFFQNILIQYQYYFVLIDGNWFYMR